MLKQIHKHADMCVAMMLACSSSVAVAVSPPAPYGAVPSPLQVTWNGLGYYGFCHFSINTFTGREWGLGDEDPKLFNPTDFDARQMVRAYKAGGMKAVVLTAKHHDGFCLWPSAYMEHSVKNSPWKNGKGDVVREFADACREEGMLFGIYLSPWDRNHAEYGRPAYVEYFRNQLRELLTNYGTISFVWLDGANGGDGYYGGARETRKIAANYYGMPETLKLIRELQPTAIVNMEMDTRWIGNEGGETPDPCWSTVRAGKLEAGDYRVALGHGVRNGVRWCGAETDVSIRPGWYYHAEQDTKVKPPAKILQMYYDAVGHGQCLILNLPPDRRGRIHDADVASVTGAGETLRKTFATNLAEGATLTPSNVRGDDARFGAAMLLAADASSYWATDDDQYTPTLTIDFAKPTTFDVVRIGEFVPLGQRIEGLALEAWQDGEWRPVAEAPCVGYERLFRLDRPLTVSKLRLRVLRCPTAVTLRNLGVFHQPAPGEAKGEQ